MRPGELVSFFIDLFKELDHEKLWELYLHTDMSVSFNEFKDEAIKNSMPREERLETEYIDEQAIFDFADQILSVAKPE